MHFTGKYLINSSAYIVNLFAKRGIEMRLKFTVVVFCVSLLSVVGWGSLNLERYNQVPGSEKWINKEIETIAAQAENINPTVLKLGLTAYQNAQQHGVKSKEILTIVDYSKPSTERRLWVIDLKNKKVLFNLHVAHGKNSGELNAKSFSNEHKSLKSSFGVFLTTNETYQGGNGYSLRMQGLERGINDNVYSRKVIFHGAAYVSEKFMKKRGMLGRSWGCMAVSHSVIKPLINTIKDKSLVFAYYPDQTWLKSSKFLQM